MSDKQNSAIHQLMSCAETGDAPGIELLLNTAHLELSASPELPHAFYTVIQNNHLDCLKALLPTCEALDAEAQNQVLQKAAEGNNLEMVCALLPFLSPKAKPHNALGWAALRGHIDVVSALLPHVTALPHVRHATLLAMSSGHLDITKMLLPYAPSTQDFVAAALRVAADDDYDAILHAVHKNDPPLALSALLSSLSELSDPALQNAPSFPTPRSPLQNLTVQINALAECFSAEDVAVLTDAAAVHAPILLTACPILKACLEKKSMNLEVSSSSTRPTPPAKM